MTAATLHISQQADDLRQIKKALVGEDLQSGLVATVKELKSRIETTASWTNFIKPLVIAVATAIVILVANHFFF